MKISKLQLKKIIKEEFKYTQENTIPKTSLPSEIRVLLDRAINKINETDLNYNQKLQIIWKVITGLKVDRTQLVRLTQKLVSVLNNSK